MKQYVQKPSDWVLHYFHRLQQNNFDCLITVSGSKGFGKSTAAIYLSRRYNELFSYICPHCGRIGYKNFYAMRGKGNSATEFYIPNYVLNDSANIRCNYEYELDMKTGEKHISAGCNKTFKWSQRKPVPWKAETYIAYDNPDIMDKVFGLPKYSPIVCLEGNALIPVKLNSGIEKYLRLKTLVGRTDFEVLTYNQDSEEFEFKKPTACIDNGLREDIYEIELVNGKSLKCTSDHLLLTQRGYVEAKHLLGSDEIKVFDGEIGVNNKSFVKINKIRKIVKNSKRSVYDIVGIPRNHNFVANGMVVHNCDESYNALGGDNHNKAENKEMKKVLNVIRPKRFLMFFCLPEMSWLDSKVREGFSSFWLRMIERGEGVLFEKDKSDVLDHFHLKEVAKATGTIKFFTPMDKIRKNLSKIPTFFSMLKIPDLPEKVYDDYEMVRNAINLQRRVEELTINNKDIAKLMTWNIVNDWDRIKINVSKSRENKVTYEILLRDILVNPVDRKSLVSEPTVRNWIRGVDDFVKSKGKDAHEFDFHDK